jgi:hypothetical protein
VERPANSRGRRRLDAFNTGRGIDRAGTANVHGGEAVAEEKAVAERRLSPRMKSGPTN